MIANSIYEQTVGCINAVSYTTVFKSNGVWRFAYPPYTC